jgi:hypothetical protein
MRVIKERIGGAEVFIQALDEDLIVLGDSPESGRQTVETSFTVDFRETYQKIRSAVRDVAADFGTELKSIAGNACPSQVEMELSLGLSTEGKIVWLVSGKGEFGLKVNITWDLSSNDNPAKTE